MPTVCTSESCPVVWDLLVLVFDLLRDEAGAGVAMAGFTVGSRHGGVGQEGWDGKALAGGPG